MDYKKAITYFLKIKINRTNYVKVKSKKYITEKTE